SSTTEALSRAVALHNAGQLPQAEQIYRHILQVAPNHAEAWHYLGVIAYQSRRYDAAIESIRRAIELGLNTTEVHFNLAAVYQAAGRLDEAIASCRRALAINPDH